jgi:hypothetical protein
MARKLAMLAAKNAKYFLFGLIVVSVVVFLIVKFTDEGFATTKVVSIYLTRTAAASNNVQFVSSTDPNVKAIAQSTANSVLLSLPDEYQLQNYAIYGYGSSWVKGKYDSGVSATFVSLKTLPVGASPASIIRAGGAANVLSTQTALPRTEPLSNILVTNLSQANFASFSPTGDIANGKANLRIDLTVMIP